MNGADCSIGQFCIGCVNAVRFGVDFFGWNCKYTFVFPYKPPETICSLCFVTNAELFRSGFSFNQHALCRIKCLSSNVRQHCQMQRCNCKCKCFRTLCSDYNHALVVVEVRFAGSFHFFCNRCNISQPCWCCSSEFFLTVFQDLCIIQILYATKFKNAVCHSLILLIVFTDFKNLHRYSTPDVGIQVANRIVSIAPCFKSILF